MCTSRVEPLTRGSACKSCTRLKDKNEGKNDFMVAFCPKGEALMHAKMCTSRVNIWDAEVHARAVPGKKSKLKIKVDEPADRACVQPLGGVPLYHWTIGTMICLQTVPTRSNWVAGRHTLRFTKPWDETLGSEGFWRVPKCFHPFPSYFSVPGTLP